MMESKSTDTTVEQLNSFLRGELSAVETYQQALKRLSDFPQRSTLEDCAVSHARRVQLLSQEVRRLGGAPATESGAWGTFAKMVEGSATAFGAKAAIAALEEGEDHGRDDYKRDAEKLEISARSIITNQVIPEQQRTHQAMSNLKRSMS